MRKFEPPCTAQVRPIFTTCPQQFVPIVTKKFKQAPLLDRALNIYLISMGRVDMAIEILGAD